MKDNRREDIGGSTKRDEDTEICKIKYTLNLLPGMRYQAIYQIISNKNIIKLIKIKN